jgi:hypothetical protein
MCARTAPVVVSSLGDGSITSAPAPPEAVKADALESPREGQPSVKFQTAAHPSVVGKLDPLCDRSRASGPGVDVMFY